MDPAAQRKLAQHLVASLMESNPAWAAIIRRRLIEGETYETWRSTFQKTIDQYPELRNILMRKTDAEPFFRILWEESREQAVLGDT